VEGAARSVGRVVNGDEFDEKVLDKFERNLVRSVGHGICGVRVDFHEEPVHSRGHRGAGQDWSKFAIAASGAAEPAGALDRVGLRIQ